MENVALKIIDNTFQKAKNNASICENDYRNHEEILMCGICHTPRERLINIDKSNKFYERYKNHHFPILCKCRKEKEAAEEQTLKKSENERLINRFRREGITDENYLRYTFENDDSKNSENISYKRIYDRILQMCYPIAVLGESRRNVQAEEAANFMGDFLGL